MISYIRPILGYPFDRLSISLLLFWENIIAFLSDFFRSVIIASYIWESTIFMAFFHIATFNLFHQKDSLDRYMLLKVIGKGSVGKVFLAVDDQTNTLVAIKSIHKSSIKSHKELEHSNSEKNILVELLKSNNLFIIQLISSFQSETELFFVFPYYSGGDLATCLSKNRVLSETNAKLIAAQVILGLEDLFNKGIIYRDLKPENLLLDEYGKYNYLRSLGYIVLSDFGLSKILVLKEFTSTFCGTFDYLAPEILQGFPYTFSVDIWSFGIILYEMLVGITPFWSEDTNIMCKNIIYSPLNCNTSLISENAKSLLTKVLKKDPAQRLSTVQIKEHPFFTGINWINLSQKKVNSLYQPQRVTLIIFMGLGSTS